MKKLHYLYCVTKDNLPTFNFEDLGIVVRSICFQGICAIVSEVLPEDFSEDNLKKNLTDMGWVEKNIRLHEKVIETVLKNSCLPDRQACVIPFKFGTLFNTEENLKIMLKQHTDKFKTTLKHLEGKEEWGVKVYCDIDKLKANLIHEDQELLSIDKEINSASPGKAFILKKKKDELIKTNVNKKLNEYGQLIFEKLNQHSTQSCINKLLPKEVTERKVEMILNSAFLIEKNKVGGFIEAEGALNKISQEMGFLLDFTGPWPPYNFTNLKKA